MTREREEFVFLCQSDHQWGRTPPPNGLMDVRSVWQQAPEVVLFLFYMQSAGFTCAQAPSCAV